jgi:hypothetical protein
MTINSSSLFKAAGAAAATAGAIFIGVQINHPPADVAHVVTTEMAVRETAKAVMAVLSLVGFAGMFLYNRRRFGVLGLAGYLLLSVGYLMMFATQVIVGFVLPTVAKTEPGYVQDVLDKAMGGSPAGEIGAMALWFSLMGFGYMIGGLLFGIALFRAGLLTRWASALLALATVSTAALAVLPESFSRPVAVPMGIALIGLGISLWRTQTRTASVPAATTGHVEPSPAR